MGIAGAAYLQQQIRIYELSLISDISEKKLQYSLKMPEIIRIKYLFTMICFCRDLLSKDPTAKLDIKGKSSRFFFSIDFMVSFH